MKKTSFSDKFLIQAAADYSYRISRYDISATPIIDSKKLVLKDFNNRYNIVLVENKAIKRKDENGNEKEIQLRYIVVEDTLVKPRQHALVFQGSDTNAESIFTGKDTDWSNNLSNAVHLEANSYKKAQDEYEYLKSLNKYNITAASGNSLGGGYALSLAKVNKDLRLIGLNPAPPEFNHKFENLNNSTIVYTSTDLLTRGLKTDIARYPKEDFQDIKDLFLKNKDPKVKTKIFDEKISSLDYGINYFYGAKSFLVKRSLYYSEIMYIEAAHRGSILEPREVILDIFNNNLVAYTSDFASKIFSQTKALLDYSRYFLKWSTNAITNKEYRDLVDNYLEKNLISVHKNRVEDYKNFPSIANFMQFDIETQDLIDEDGQLFTYQKSFTIKDKQLFIDNLEKSLSDYREASIYPISRVIHDIEEERYISEDSNSFKTIKTFFASDFNVKLNLDLDLIEVFSGLPVSILINIAELLDKNRRYLKGLKDNLVEYFKKENEQLNKETTIEKYRSLYTNVSQNIYDNVDILYKNLSKVKFNLDLVFKKDVSLALGFRYFEGKKVIKDFRNIQPLEIKKSLKDEIIGEENLLKKQYSQVLSIIDEYRINSVFELSENVEKSQEIVKSSIEFIEKKVEKNPGYHLDKLSKQLQAMLKNVDLKTIYYNSLNVFRYDIAAFALRNTVSHSIITHYKQLFEANQQIKKMTINLKLYVEENTSSLVKERMINDLNVILSDIEDIDEFINLFI